MKRICACLTRPDVARREHTLASNRNLLHFINYCSRSFFSFVACRGYVTAGISIPNVGFWEEFLGGFQVGCHGFSILGF